MSPPDMGRVEQPTSQRNAVAVCAAGAFVVTAGWRFLTFSGFNNDHYVHLAGAQQLLLGEWPIRDFVDAGIPLMYAVHAAARAVFGPALGVEWAVVTAGFAIAAACTLVASYRLSASLGVAIVATALEIAIYPRSFGYPKLVLYAVAALVIMAGARGFTVRTLLGSAVVTVVAFLFRHDHGVFIGLAAETALIVDAWPSGWRTALQRSLGFTAAVVLLLLPWLIFVETQQGLAAYVASGVAVSEGEAIGNALRELPRMSVDLAPDRNALAWLFYTFHVLPLLSLSLLVAHRSEEKAWPGETATVAAIAVMAIPVNLTFLRGNLDGRVPDAVVPAALLGSWLAGRVLRRGWLNLPLAFAATVVVITVWAVARVGAVTDNLDKADMLRGPGAVRVRALDLWDRLGRRVPERDHVPSRYAQALLPFMDYVGRCTAPQDRLLVTGLFPEINVIADRGFAGGHLSYRPDFYTSAADQALTVARLQRQSVPLVVSIRQVYPELRKQMPALMDYMDRRFEPLAYVAVPETQGIDLFVERGRSAAALDSITGWPCFQRRTPPPAAPRPATSPSGLE